MAKRIRQQRHGMKGTKIYMVWEQVKARCNNPNNKRYSSYGGRGIYVCKEWNDSFVEFYNDMIDGYSEGLQLDRADNDGPYTRENCRWVTPGVNGANKRHVGNLPKGVAKNNNQFRAQFGLYGQKYHLGNFKTPEEAHEAFSVIHREWYGF